MNMKANHRNHHELIIVRFAFFRLHYDNVRRTFPVPSRARLVPR
jgi:hypothetical protein